LLTKLFCIIRPTKDAKTSIFLTAMNLLVKLAYNTWLLYQKQQLVFSINSDFHKLFKATSLTNLEWWSIFEVV